MFFNQGFIMNAKSKKNAMPTTLDNRFFDSTRGRIVSMLRGAKLTVEELALGMDLTDNAVRAHLATLERDGLVVQRGIRRGFRKPHFTYALSAEGEALFPKAYDHLLNTLIEVLKTKMSAEAIDEVFKEVAAVLAPEAGGGKNGTTLEARAERGIEGLATLGGKARYNQIGDDHFITSDACPLAAVVERHPEACLMAEALVSRLTGLSVEERCDRAGPPKCRFLLQP